MADVTYLTRLAPTPLVALAASTGGPSALADLMAVLPPDLGAPIVITQHMPASFVGMLTERLSSMSSWTVLEACSGMEPMPGVAFVAPGDRHLELKRRGHRVFIELGDGPAENSCRPSADPMLRSAARIYGDRLLSVVLTGMGRDGAAGCGEVVRHGGRVFIQDEGSSVVWGMPGAVAAAQLPHETYSLEMLGPAIVRHVRSLSALRAVATP